MSAAEEIGYLYNPWMSPVANKGIGAVVRIKADDGVGFKHDL